MYFYCSVIEASSLLRPFGPKLSSLEIKDRRKVSGKSLSLEIGIFLLNVSFHFIQSFDFFNHYIMIEFSSLFHSILTTLQCFKLKPARILQTFGHHLILALYSYRHQQFEIARPSLPSLQDQQLQFFRLTFVGYSVLLG